MAEDVVIRAEGLGKKYMIEHVGQRDNYAALRDSIARGARNMRRNTANFIRGGVIVAGDDPPAVSRQFVGGEILRIADANDLRARVMAEAPGRKGDRRQIRLQMAWRHTDQQPADPVLSHRREFPGHGGLPNNWALLRPGPSTEH